MRLMMARSGSPHHGFMAFYTYLSKVFNADGVIHFGTHGALEFMPGKQIGLSGECWPDRLIDELPNFYVYSVNNPSEGSIAKRRSYAELISYLTPPIENAGLYKELAGLKDLVMAYRQSTNEPERDGSIESIEELQQLTNAHFGLIRIYPFNPCSKFVWINTMYERFNAIDRNHGNVVLIFSEQLIIRFDIDLFQSELIAATGAHDCRLRLVAEVTAGTRINDTCGLDIDTSCQPIGKLCINSAADHIIFCFVRCGALHV